MAVLPTIEIVHKAERAYLMYNAMATLTGNAGRAHKLLLCDSNGMLNTPCRRDGSANETPDQPASYWEGQILAYHRAGITVWGLPMSSQCNGGTWNSTTTCTGWQASIVSDFPVTPVGTFAEPYSFPYNDAYFCGHLAVINATTANNPTSLSSGETFSWFYPYDQQNTNSSWVNPYILGDPKSVAVRFNYSYMTPDAAAINLYIGVSKWTQGLLAENNHTAGTSLAWSHQSLSVPANAATYALQAQLYGYGTHRSTGPVAVGFGQWCLSTINPQTPTTGPGGIAITLIRYKFGDTLALVNSDLKAAGIPALAAAIQCAMRSADWLEIDCLLMGNDTRSGNNSFQYSDTPGAPTGPANNTVSGHVINFTTFCRLWTEAMLAAGKSLDKLIIRHGPYHPSNASPTVTLQPQLEQAICDLVDTGAAYMSRVVVVRGTRVMTSKQIKNMKGYNGPVGLITGISAANPPVITSAGHGLTSGDQVEFFNTNSTPALHSPTSCGQYYITKIDANTFRPYTDPARTTSINVTGAGTAGTCFMQWDESHLRSDMYVAYCAAGEEAMVAAVAQAAADASLRRILPIPMY